jgi:di/tricarboxylate transporter
VTVEIAWFLAILAIAIGLFAWEGVPADVVALGVLLTLIVTGLLPVDVAFAGFGSDAVMMILGLLIMTAALMRTGVVEMAGRLIVRLGGEEPNRLLLVIMVSVAALSAFISNTAATAFFLPIVFGIASRAKRSASQFLMPLAFASILTSSCTLVSTSTNIVISDLMTRYSHAGAPLAPMGMFELAPVGIPIAVAGIAYLWLVGRRWIPDRAAGEKEEQFGLRPYMSEVMVLPNSPLVGKTLAEAGLGRDLELTVLEIVRHKDTFLPPIAQTVLAAGDVLLVEGTTEQILKVKDAAGIDIKADAKLADPKLESEDVALVEAILLPHSSLIGRTLKISRFRQRYGLQVLAIKRAGGTLHEKLSGMRLRMGDVLLLQGHRGRIRALEQEDDLRVLGGVDHTRPNLRRAPAAIAIFVLSLAAATFKLLPLPVAALLGAFLAFASRSITPEVAYREIEWKAVIVIGCMLALGSAMEKTGTESYLAVKLLELVGEANPLWLLSGFFVLTVALTQPMSNQAAAVVVLPVAIRTALQLDLNPRTFAMMVAVAASCSYLTPLEPSCLMVYGPGRYRFSDFFRVGGILTVIIFLVAIALVPLVWPLRR